MHTNKISVLRELRLCTNCSNKGHLAGKCQAPPMCKKCMKFHHPLLHRDVDRTQRKPESKKGKDETHASVLSVSEQVLLMTCKVKITAPNGSSTIARTLINPASLSSFIHENLAQHLCLMRSSKNSRVEGIGKPAHLHEALFGSKCLASSTIVRKMG